MCKILALCVLVKLIEAKDLDMSNDDEFMAGVYLKAPVKPIMKFYFFNLTNPDDFLEGATPIFNEVGPYAYKYVWHELENIYNDQIKMTNRIVTICF